MWLWMLRSLICSFKAGYSGMSVCRFSAEDSQWYRLPSLGVKAWRSRSAREEEGWCLGLCGQAESDFNLPSFFLVLFRPQEAYMMPNHIEGEQSTLLCLPIQKTSLFGNTVTAKPENNI